MFKKNQATNLKCKKALIKLESNSSRQIWRQLTWNKIGPTKLFDWTNREVIWYNFTTVKWYHISSQVSFLVTALSHWYPHKICNKCLLLAEFEGRIVSYVFFQLQFIAQARSTRAMNWSGKKRAKIYSTDRENEVSKMFITSVGNWVELESTSRTQGVRTLEYGPLNRPITAYVLPGRYNGSINTG